MKDNQYGKISMDFDELLEIIKKLAQDTGITLRKMMTRLRDEYGINAEKYAEMIKIAWNYEELNTVEFSQKDAIRWIKNNMDIAKHSGACLYKDADAPLVIMHLFFLDKENKPLLGAEDRHLEIHCKMMDEGLAAQFGDKDTIVFK